MGISPRTSTQCSNDISLLSERICPHDLQKRQWKDDECLGNVSPGFFLLRKRTGSHVSDLEGQVPHDG